MEFTFNNLTNQAMPYFTDEAEARMFGRALRFARAQSEARVKRVINTATRRENAYSTLVNRYREENKRLSNHVAELQRQLNEMHQAHKKNVRQTEETIDMLERMVAERNRHEPAMAKYELSDMDAEWMERFGTPV
jgi:predicted RNase H-like nuclease (RuvC/YqgF family)